MSTEIYTSDNDIRFPNPRYIRGGECNQCGDCCIDEECKYFEKNGNITTCKISDSSDRPKKCVWYPEAPPIIFEKCSYYFFDRWENNRRVGVKEV